MSRHHILTNVPGAKLLARCSVEFLGDVIPMKFILPGSTAVVCEVKSFNKYDAYPGSLILSVHLTVPKNDDGTFDTSMIQIDGIGVNGWKIEPA